MVKLNICVEGKRTCCETSFNLQYIWKAWGY